MALIVPPFHFHYDGHLTTQGRAERDFLRG